MLQANARIIKFLHNEDKKSGFEKQHLNGKIVPEPLKCTILIMGREDLLLQLNSITMPLPIHNSNF